MQIYVIMCQCDDSYYPGHISSHKKAFSNEEEAKTFLLELNGTDEDEYTAQYGPMFYITEVTLK